MARTPSSNPSNQNRAARAPMSKESRFIGYLVLGFGVLAIITVLILAFGGGEKTEKKNTKKETPVQEVVKLAPELLPAAPAPVVKKVEPLKEELLFKRNPNFDAAKMNGEWQAAIGDYTAVLQVDKNVYQVILAGENEQVARIYSSGTFKVMEDIVMLTPQKNWPQPATESKEIKYRKLTTAAFPVVAYFNDDEMIWQNPPRSEKRVLTPRKSPLLLSQDQEAILWKRLK